MPISFVLQGMTVQGKVEMMTLLTYVHDDIKHYCDVTGALRSLKSPTARMFVQPLAKFNNTEQKYQHNCLYVRVNQRSNVNSPSKESTHKEHIMWKAFPYHDVIIENTFAKRNQIHDIRHHWCEQKYMISLFHFYAIKYYEASSPYGMSICCMLICENE